MIIYCTRKFFLIFTIEKKIRKSFVKEICLLVMFLVWPSCRKYYRKRNITVELFQTFSSTVVRIGETYVMCALKLEKSPTLIGIVKCLGYLAIRILKLYADF